MFVFEHKGRRFVLNGVATPQHIESCQRRIVDMVWAQEQGKDKFYKCFQSKEAQRLQSEINWQEANMTRQGNNRCLSNLYNFQSNHY